MTAAQRTMAVLITILLVVVLATFGQYGFTVDESKGVGRAQRVLAFLMGGWHANASVSGVDTFHGAAPDVIALVLQRLIPPLSYDSRHLVCALFGVAGIFYVYRLGSKFAGEWVGVFAAIFLAVTPMWFGYMFINHKDIPFATLLVASSYYCLVALTEHAPSRGLLLKLGLSIGLLASTKVAGLPFLAYIVAIYLVCLTTIPSQRKFHLAPNLGRRIGWVCLAGLLGSLLCFVAFWPQFYLFDIVLRDMQQKPVFAKDTKTLVSPFYASMYFTISMPVFLLVLGGVGAACALYRREAAIVAAMIVVVSIFVAQALTGVYVYNGTRHLLFLYPFFMLTAAYPVALALDLTTQRMARVALVGVLSICIAGTIIEMYRLFPYQYSFYNSLVGGFAGADGVYEIDTWRSAHREAMNHIARRVKPGDTVHVYSCGSKLDYKYLGFERAPNKEDADYFIALRRGVLGRCAPKVFEGLPVIGEVRRQGVLLAKIFAAR